MTHKSNLSPARPGHTHPRPIHPKSILKGGWAGERVKDRAGPNGPGKLSIAIRRYFGESHDRQKT